VSLDGLECPTVDASDVDHFVCTSETVSKSDPVKTFHTKPRSMVCAIKAPLPKSIGGNVQASVNFTVGLCQLPMLVNIATAGHKPKGQTKAKLVMSVWSQRKNWYHVALSRVQTREGLHLVQESPWNADFSMSHSLREMTKRLKQCAPDPIEWDLNEERETIKERHCNANCSVNRIQ